MSSIDTGGVFVDSGSQPYDSSTLSAAGIVLFQPGDSDIYSKVFAIPDGKQAILRAYNVNVDGYLNIQNVVLGSSALISTNKSCCLIDLPTRDKQLVLYSSNVVINSKSWLLSSTTNTGVISLPGYYRLVASDASILENLFVSLQVTSIIPKVDNHFSIG